MTKMTKKQIEIARTTLTSEKEAVEARMAQIEALDHVTVEEEHEHWVSVQRSKAIDSQLFELSKPISKVCRNAYNLAAENID